MLLALVHGSASAQTAPLAGSDFTALSDRIFTGRVVAQVSFPSDDGRLILTRTTFEVDLTLRGEPLAVAEVIEYGGRLGEKWLHVTHGARYREGGEYLVFARLDPRGRLRTLGGWQGQLPILRDGGGGAVVRMYAQHPLSARFFPDRRTNLLPLDEVREVLAGAIRRPR